MLIVKGVIKTSEVKFCRYNTETKKWDIEYEHGGVYGYAYGNVEWLKEPEVLNTNLYRISRNGRTLFGIREIEVFGGKQETYWHICYENGSERDYLERDLTITKSILKEGQARDVFAYLKQISKLSDLKNAENGKQILPEKYEKITFVGENTVLAGYLKPEKVEAQKAGPEYVPIFPFGCNKSQYQAVKNAMEHPLSVIQGPPGTGKTQTILNIIANILIQGKTVQIVSNNNAATENVYEKLASPKYDLGFIVAMLGNSENKKRFIDQQSLTYPDFQPWRLTEEDKETVTLAAIKGKSERLQMIFQKQERLALLRQEQAQIKLEMRYFAQYLQSMGVEFEAMKKSGFSRKWIALWQECQTMSEQDREAGLLFVIKGLFRYGIWDFKFYKQGLSEMIMTVQGMYYHCRQRELTEEISEIEELLRGPDRDLLNIMCSQSMALLKDFLARKYAGGGARQRFEEDDLWKNPAVFLREYPVILSTTFSSRSSLNQETVYDYLIMDEASQVDVATGALALSCAKNAIIVGDTKQLPNVVPEHVRKQADSIFASFQIADGYRFTTSFLQSVLDVIPGVTQTLLREHYRCHPKIINFCNQKFYRGQLVIMTEDRGEKDVLRVMKTVKGNHARERYSQRQIDVIRQEIIPQYVSDPAQTGIIAPYRNQVEAMEHEFSDMDVATVHKFQGREKDTIIISTVDDELSDFADDPYLLNVAVSRAKKRLMLVVSGNEQSPERNISELIAYIQYHNFEVKDSRIYSIFDYLYKQYAEARQEYLKKHKRISEYDSENLMSGLIAEVLDCEAFASLDQISHQSLKTLIRDTGLLNESERNYVMNPATHLDFIIYNRISRRLVLVVEVDGYDYHKEGTVQAERDKMKNHILERYEIPYIRFQTNGSGEEKRLKERLEEIVGAAEG